MQSRVIEFAGVLRRNGIRVSTAETLDALRSVELAGLGEREAFQSALRAAMVKRAVDLDPFDTLFESFFTGLGNLIQELAASGSGPASAAELQQFIEHLDELAQQVHPSLSELAEALALQQTGTLERLLRELMDSGRLPSLDSPMTAPAAARMVAAMLGAGGLAEEFDRLLEAAREAGATEEELERLRAYLDQRMKDLGQLIKGLLRLKQQQREQGEEQEREHERLLDKSFYYLSPTEIRKMREAVAALARKLKNVLAIRRRRAKRGRLDVKETLRCSMEFGGVPFRVRYERKRRERPQVVILCDVSDSVRNVSRFMLQFVHSLQDMYSRVRSYVFVADIGEVTRLFSENEIQAAIHEAIAGNVVNVYAHSDFGRAFKRFHRDHLEVIDARTTVIILGDARNNYNAPNEWVLRELQQRARQVIWLNPENRSTWGFGDSEMERYARYCDVVEECRNLRQLYRVVDRMVLV